MPKIYIVAQVCTDDTNPLSEAAAANVIQQTIEQHAQTDAESLVNETLHVVFDILCSHKKPKQIVDELRDLLQIE